MRSIAESPQFATRTCGRFLFRGRLLDVLDKTRPHLEGVPARHMDGQGALGDAMKYSDDLIASIKEAERQSASSIASWLIDDRGFDALTVGHFTFRQKDVSGSNLPIMSFEQASWWWRHFVQSINREVGGNHYQRKWKHSYFSYVCGLEAHKSGWPHFHVVIDGYIDYGWVIGWWSKNCGYVKLSRCNEGKKSIEYSIKYAIKGGGAPLIWLAKERYQFPHTQTAVVRLNENSAVLPEVTTDSVVTEPWGPSEVVQATLF